MAAPLSDAERRVLRERLRMPLVTLAASGKDLEDAGEGRLAELQ